MTREEREEFLDDISDHIAGAYVSLVEIQGNLSHHLDDSWKQKINSGLRNAREAEKKFDKFTREDE